MGTDIRGGEHAILSSITCIHARTGQEVAILDRGAVEIRRHGVFVEVEISEKIFVAVSKPAQHILRCSPISGKGVQNADRYGCGLANF
jgi:hypothetical protein